MITFQQTDVASICGSAIYCSANSLNGTTNLRQATVGGIPGTGVVSPIMDRRASVLIAVFFECIIGPGIRWNAGTWTVNLNVTITSTRIKWTGLDICRISSVCANLTSIATANPNISLNTSGVKTVTVSGSAQIPSAGDKVMVLLSFSNSVNAFQSFGFLPNQTIVSPFSLPSMSQGYIFG